MLAVTIGTTGRAGCAQRMAHAVDTGGVLFGRFFVAGGAVDRFGRHVVVRMLGRDVRVATGAGVGAMHRSCKFRFIDKEPDRLAGRVGFIQRFIGMAFQADRVGILFVSGRASARQE